MVAQKCVMGFDPGLQARLTPSDHAVPEWSVSCVVAVRNC